jgi:hypothetical protein
MTRILSLPRAFTSGFSALSLAAVLFVGYDDGDDRARRDDEAQKAPAAAQATTPGEKVTVSFSDPSRPGKLQAHLLSGSITVKGYEGKDVQIETHADDDQSKPAKEKGGLRQIRNTASGLEVEEEHNEMRIKSDAAHSHPVRMSISVPRSTTLDLSIVNDGDIIVENIDADITADNINGFVTLTNVSGAVVAHALNHDVKAVLTRFAGKPMSFTSLNGTLDITLPPDTKANVKMQSDNGGVYSDFAIDMVAPSINQTVEDKRGQGGKYRLKIEKGMIGKINGGGPEITLKTFNGDIKLHRP